MPVHANDPGAMDMVEHGFEASKMDADLKDEMKKTREHNIVLQVEGNASGDWKLVPQTRPKKERANLSCIKDTLSLLKKDEDRIKNKVDALSKGVEFCWMAQAVSTNDLSPFPNMNYEELCDQFEQIVAQRTSEDATPALTGVKKRVQNPSDIM
eukprot:gnl/MRDRNA2_/MRDRNA2_95884_c0_seq1.p1 gnl/MRDRNA2_/MRDRNA2_95884_c0~~gnl/MRDRNA2_/MRDRNA2_95884_c0_seq1.p1  ORF type:complete len:154 (+),score=38.08 gnl/MRDRNA2_/MRDRNA2_95884_c0_seq1:68-529(+)